MGAGRAGKGAEGREREACAAKAVTRTEATLTEIVDEIFLPLVRPAGTPKARTFGGDGTGL
ncbi:hypothetical protein ACIGMX_07365 [Streptomyces aquilus]|uniref:Uncharacterized protein n=1 Tax=Streptomyces aquilus TaxID=2548456 RepID=A0A3S9I803_9ACTN|nr:hypothetical protein [Streptomyces aquilus]AZP20469.1 hypothetical protein EJC51_32985 [Streptomyces aquilus]